VTVQIHLGDCLDVMRGMPDGCVDAVVTDPPYGLAFMGKQWDRGVPGVEFWAEALRVAKPGAHLLAFGGTRTFHRLACAIEDAGWQIKDCLSWLYGSGFPKHKTLLKPAWEPVVMAAKAGARVVNVDACRLSASGNKTFASRFAGDRSREKYRTGTASSQVPSSLGRWPANVCLDEAAAAALDEQSGTLQSGFMRAGTTRSTRSVCYGAMPADAAKRDTIADKGGASRFFYCAKASRSEREAGLDGFEERLSLGARFSNPSANGDRPQERRPFANHHPTVKPVALMRWLVRLVAPTDGVVLDPFMGSGTTGVACVREGRSFVGIEREPEYHAIAEARIAHARGETPVDAEQPALPFEVSA
jgi:site-specific DNA-methyltransferase (adenine-specific)